MSPELPEHTWVSHDGHPWFPHRAHCSLCGWVGVHNERESGARTDARNHARCSATHLRKLAEAVPS